MAFQFCSCWTSFCIIIFLLKNNAANPPSPPQYILNPTKVSFNEAVKRCAPGNLTTIATDQEVREILNQILESKLFQDTFTLWVGLKLENECTDQSKPLRGFRWLESGSQESQVSRWAKEIAPTCITTRCAALEGHFKDMEWGLVPLRCDSKNAFICKLRDRLTGRSPEDRQYTIKPEPAKPERTPTEPVQPTTPGTISAPLEPLQPSKPEPTHELSEQEPKLPTVVSKSNVSHTPGPGSGLAPASDSCRIPDIPNHRALSLDPKTSRTVRVECWSTIQLKLFCSGQPTMWRMLDGTEANFSAICLDCSPGFQKDTSGHCVDVDECSELSPCKHTCLNTEGSYRCICSDDNGDHPDTNSAGCNETTWQVEGPKQGASWLIPVLIVVGVLVVLLVVITVMVKCCLRKRSKKRAIKKAEKMATRSKNGKDSFRTANEKITK